MKIEAKKAGTLGTLLKKLNKASVLILDEWAYVLYDEEMTAALVGRLMHHCYLQNNLACAISGVNSSVKGSDTSG